MPQNEAKFEDALLALKYAISYAWEDTRGQVKSANYDPRIVQTAFGQFLVHNVMNRIYQLNEGYSQSFTAELRPNRTKNAHHITVRVASTLLTVSAVEHENVRPRPAMFREDYASRQGFFAITNQNTFIPTSPPVSSARPKTYLQILHGPRVDDRCRLGFLLVAKMNRFNEYEGKPVPLDELLTHFQAQRDEVEEIRDGISIRIKDGAKIEPEKLGDADATR